MIVSRYKIQPQDEHLFEKFMKNPFGPHCPDLQRILNLFRGCGELRYALLVTKPHEEWVLVTIKEAGTPLEIHQDFFFTDLAEAEREIFRRRWDYHTKS
jgi:hypothetical protein